MPLPRPRLRAAHADMIARASSCTLWLMVVLGGNRRLRVAGEVHVFGVAPLCLCQWATRVPGVVVEVAVAVLVVIGVLVVAVAVVVVVAVSGYVADVG